MGWVLLIITTLCIIFFDAGFVMTEVRDWRASRFPTVTGVILDSRIDQSTLGTGFGTGSDYYRGVIRYKYTVGAHVYESDRMSYTEHWVSRESAKRFVDSHKVGQPIRVYYNPRNPTDAVLFPSVWDDARVWLLVLLPFNAVLVILWVYGIRSIGKAKSGAGAGRLRGIRFETDQSHG